MKAHVLLLLFLLAVFTACSWFVPGEQTVPDLLSTSAPPTATGTIVPFTPLPTSSPIPTATITLSPAPSLTAQPTWEWPRSSPEEQGLSSDRLAAMLEAIRQEYRKIHSVLVIRHGVLVLEAYPYPFNAQTRHGVYSVTKSITSALVGIAIGDELLSGVDTPVITYFPSVILDYDRKKDILVENLLAMNSGIEWSEPQHSGLSDLWAINEAENPAQYFFDRALVEEPGTVYNYNSGGSHLLSMMVQEVSGETAADFAAQRLFAPLGISDFSWQEDFTGHSQGGTGLELLPVDMAKIGQLYLDGGQWQGNQILPADWVSDSMRVHSVYSPDVSYGYQWWLRAQGDVYALGWGGQQIRIFPEQDMVVVFTAGMSGTGMLHDDLVDTYLIPAVVAHEPLPAKVQAQTRREAAIETFSSPQTWPSSPLPAMAAEIDGKQWLVTGVGTWSIFSFHFLSESEAQMDLTIEGDPMPLMVGLDGIMRVTDTRDYGPIAMVGYWESDDTFAVVQQNLREADRRLTHLQFRDDETVGMFIEWFVEPYQEESEAVLLGN